MGSKRASKSGGAGVPSTPALAPLARAGQLRERDAFEELARRVYAVVLPTVQLRLWQRLAQVISADDVTQNVMVKLTEGLQGLEIRTSVRRRHERHDSHLDWFLSSVYASS